MNASQSIQRSTTATSRKQTAAIIGFLFLLNFLSGLLFINQGLFHSDSVFIAQAVEKTYATAALQPSFRGRYGSVVVNFLFSLPFLIAGKNADLPVRLCSIFFHAASIVMLFFLVKEYTGNRRTALFSALLLSFIPFYFSPDTYGKEHGLSVFLFLAALTAQSRGISRQSLRLAGNASLLYLCSITVRESMLILAPVFFLAAVRARITRRPFRIAFFEETRSKQLFFFSAGLWLALFLLLLKLYLGKSLADALLTENHAATHWIFRGDYLWEALGDLFRSMPMPWFPLLPLGIYRMATDRNYSTLTLLLVWICSFFYLANTTTYAPRYLELSVIPAVIFSAYYLNAIEKVPSFLRYGFVGYCMLSMAVFMCPLLAARHRYNGMKESSAFIHRLTEDNASIIAADTAGFIEYYARRKTMIVPVNESEKAPQAAKDFIDRITAALKKNVPVYIVASAFSYDTEDRLKRMFSAAFTMGYQGKYLAEDFHQAEIDPQFYYEKIWKVSLKKAGD